MDEIDATGLKAKDPVNLEGEHMVAPRQAICSTLRPEEVSVADRYVLASRPQRANSVFV